MLPVSATMIPIRAARAVPQRCAGRGAIRAIALIVKPRVHRGGLTAGQAKLCCRSRDSLPAPLVDAGLAFSPPQRMS